MDRAGIVSTSELAATRRWNERLLGAAGTALVVFLAFYFPDRSDGSGAMFGAIFAFGAVALGMAATGRTRPLPRRTGLERTRLFAFSIAAGGVLGIANLLANRAIALLDARIYRQMIEEWAGYSAWSMIIAGPLVEEIAFRLALMGGVAWLLTRVTNDRRTIFLVALAASSVLFGLAHIVVSSRPVVDVVHGTGVALKSGAAGVCLGWVFWRLGLPYSVVCHGVANAVHLVLAPLVF